MTRKAVAEMNVFGEGGQFKGMSQKTPEQSQHKRDPREEEPHRNRQGDNPGEEDAEQKCQREPEEGTHSR